MLEPKVDEPSVVKGIFDTLEPTDPLLAIAYAQDMLENEIEEPEVVEGASLGTDLVGVRFDFEPSLTVAYV